MGLPHRSHLYSKTLRIPNNKSGNPAGMHNPPARTLQIRHTKRHHDLRRCAAISIARNVVFNPGAQRAYSTTGTHANRATTVFAPAVGVAVVNPESRICRESGDIGIECG